MSFPRFSFARLARSEFSAEWCAIAALLLLDILWASRIDFRLVLGWQDAILPCAAFVLVCASRGLGFQRAGNLIEYLCLSVAGSAALIVLSYLCMASAGPLVDSSLLAADRALGFDWIGLYHRMLGHPQLVTVLRLAYQSALVQGFYCTILLALMNQLQVMKELWRLTFVASVICCVGAMLFPALGPFKVFGLESQAVFLPDMEHLLSRQNLTFSPGAMTGVICFPSFHTVLALACPYGLRHTKSIFYIFVAINAVMLLSIPFFGGHYLVDMIAGVAVTLVALGAVRTLDYLSQRWTVPLTSPLAAE